MTVDFAFLDSGTGGLPYMEYLHNMCPQAHCLYLADTGNFPYGEKSPQEVIQATDKAVQSIIDSWNPKAIVLACNTMSVTALQFLRHKYPLVPFIGTVPAVKLGVSLSSNKIIGLLATQGTINHPYTKKLIQDFASDCTVVCRGDGELIRFIEENLLTASQNEIKKALMPALTYFAEKKTDTIILGCTHFIHVADNMRKLVPPGIKIIDSRDGVVRQALKVVETKKASESAPFGVDIPDRSFFITGLPKGVSEEHYKAVCQQFSAPWGGVIS